MLSSIKSKLFISWINFLFLKFIFGPSKSNLNWYFFFFKTLKAEVNIYDFLPCDILKNS